MMAAQNKPSEHEGMAFGASEARMLAAITYYVFSQLD